VKLIPTPVAPIDTRVATVLANPGGLRQVNEPVYPDHPSGDALRTLRHRCDLALREAAKVLGLPPAEVSSLERGSATLAPEAWCQVFVALAAEWERRNPPGGSNG
jgi:hypothetical protein